MQRKWKRRWHRMLTKVAIASVAMTMICFSAYNPVMAGPAGGVVITGNGNITTNGNTTTITQSTSKMGINWQSFNIGMGEKVQFIQPNGNSIALNRIIGNNPSSIYGNLSANGQIFLVNPNGILFSPTAQVNVGGLVASTLPISDHDFAAGKYIFNGTGGTVNNQGTITAKNGGYVALLGAQAKNEGVIIAQQGTAIIGAGSKATLDFHGDGMVSLAVDQSTVNALAQNSGLIQADGGQVIMTGRAAGAVVGSVVNNAGIIQAKSISTTNGVIHLDGGTQGEVINSGRLDASGISLGQKGGTVKVLGEKVTLSAGAVVDVSGDLGGGTALIGGNYQGKGIEQNARMTTVASGAQINGNAISNGNGGQVVVWANDSTTFSGNITARGGAKGGDGGNVEVSGKQTLAYKGFTDVHSDNGKNGNLTLDPADFTIGAGGDITGALLASQLESGNVTILSNSGVHGGTNGDVFLTEAVHWHTNNTLTLSAYRDINVTQVITPGSGGNVVLRSDNTGISTGTVNFTGSGLVALSGGGINSIYYNPTAYTTPKSYAGKTTGGTGNAYMLVNTLTQLQALNTNRSGSYALGNNIDASGTASWNSGAGFVPIGAEGTPFTGKFNGNGYTIDKLTVNLPSYMYVGLFGNITNATISNVGVTGVTVKGMNYVGGLVGWNTNSLITDSYTTGTVTGGGGSMEVGGLVGWNLSNTIRNCYSEATVSGTTNVGGLVGINDGTVSGCYSIGSVTGSAYVGGLVGYNDATATIKNSYWDIDTSHQSVASDTSLGGGTQISVAGVRSSTGNTAFYGANYNFDYTNSWRIYDGHSRPLLKSLLVPITVTGSNASKGYDGTPYGGSFTATYSAVGGPLLLGALTYTPSGGLTSGGNHSIVWDGLYSTTQQGYNVIYVNGTLAITPKTLTATQIGSVTKSYDGSTVASIINSNLQLFGILGSDVVTVTGTGTYSSKDNGSRSVTVTGTSLGGANGGSYILAASDVAGGTLTGQINKKALTAVQNATVMKTYDGGKDANFDGTNVQLVGVAGSEAVTVSGIGSYVSKDQGSRSVNILGAALNGADMGNYTLVISDIAGGNLTGRINQKALTAVQTSTVTKVYDGGADGNYDASNVQLVGVVGSEAVNIGGTGTYFTKDQGSRNMHVDSVSLWGADMGNYTLAPFDVAGGNLTGQINKRALTGTQTGIVTKVYDGGTGANFNSSNVHLVGVNGSEDVTVSGVGTYASKDQGNRNVNLTSLVLGGIDAGNYTLGTSDILGGNLAGQINKKALTAVQTGIVNKVYDGGLGANFDSSNVQLVGVVGTEVVTANGTGTYAGKDQGSRNVNIVSAVLGGVDNGNYTLTTTGVAGGTLTGQISKRVVTGIQTGTVVKSYDGGADATFDSSNVHLVGVVGSEVVTASGAGSYASKDQGNHNVSLTSAALGGVDAGNYTLVTSDILGGNLAGHINKKALTAVQTGIVNKVYDGGLVANFDSSNVQLVGVVGTEVVTANGTGTYAGKDQGSRNVNIASAVLGGVDCGNYTLATTGVAGGTLTGQISKRAVTGIQTGTVAKSYDGSTSASFDSSNVQLVGVVGSEAVTVSGAGSYAGKDQGNHNVSLTSAVLGGVDAGNYTLVTSDILGGNLAGHINKKALTAVQTGIVNKVYDGGLGANFDSSNVQLVGVVGSEGVTASGTGSYAGKDQGSRNVNLTSAALGGIDAGNYTLVTSDIVGGNLVGHINKKALTAVQTGTVNKIYNGGTDATFDSNNVQLVGVVGSEVITASGTGTYATKDQGNHNVNLTSSALGGVDAGNYTLATSDIVGGNLAGQINKKALTAVQTGTVNKVYNGGTDANFDSSNVQLIGVVGSEGVTASGTGTYASKDQGNRNVNLTSAALAGIDAGNYTLVTSDVVGGNLAGQINKKALTGMQTGTVHKAYDGGTDADFDNSNVQLLGVVGSEVVTASGTGTYAGKDQGNHNVNLTSAALGGVDAGNYTLGTSDILGGNLAGQINKKALTAVQTGTVHKVYDGGTGADFDSSNVQLLGVVGTEVVTANGTGTYGAKDQGSRNVNIVATSLQGADAGNYTLVAADVAGGNLSGNIGVKVLTATQKTTVTKIYDGGRDATFSTDNLQLVGLVGSEAVTVSGTGTYAGKDHGNSNVSVGSVSLTGTDAANYTLAPTDITSGTLAGQIDKKTVTTSGIRVVDKVYDGNAVATVDITGAALVGTVAGEQVDLVTTGVTGHFMDKKAGVGKEVIVNGLTISGSDGDNYLLGSDAFNGNINKAVLVVAGSDATKVTGKENPAFTSAYSGFVGGDTSSDLSGGLRFALTPGAGTPGNYVIDQSGLIADNYTFDYRNGHLTVTSSLPTDPYIGAVGSADGISNYVPVGVVRRTSRIYPNLLGSATVTQSSGQYLSIVNNGVNLGSFLSSTK